MKEKIVDVLTGEETLRDYSAEEIANVQAEQAKAQELIEAQAAKAAEKVAVLAKLGLTADEVAALLS